MNFCRVLIWLQSPFPLPPQLSKHLPNLSLSLSSLRRDLPVQADRKEWGEEPDKTTGKKRELPSNVFPSRTAFPVAETVLYKNPSPIAGQRYVLHGYMD